MRVIGSLIGLLITAAIVGVIYKYYLAPAGSTGMGAATPVQTIDVVGVKNDLLAIAQSERVYMAEHGNYVSLDDLISSGSISMTKSGRDGFIYDVEISQDSFRAVAHCPAAATPGCTSYSIDPTMQVQTLP